MNICSGSTMPVLVTSLSLDRSASLRGAMSRFMSSVIHRGLIPRMVTRCSSHMRTNTSGPGRNGEPSYRMLRPPITMWAMLARYMTQPVVVYCRCTSSGPRLRCNPPSFWVDMRTVPTPWTMALGMPVVPDE